MRRFVWLVVMPPALAIAVVGAAVLLAAGLVVLAVDMLAWLLCAAGAHRPGHWVRANMTKPVLDGYEALHQWSRKLGRS